MGLPARIRGVNLGGWLVLEKWMTPALFEGLAATDETTWCVELGADAAPRLQAHRESFITRADFEWLAARGINAVRLPVGHWVLGPPVPWHAKYGASPFPFIKGADGCVDRALEWARDCGIAVLLDLHAAPGCQNGFDNGGLLGVCDWPANPEYVDFSVDLLGRMAARWGHHPALGGIQVLNEPRWDIPTPLLKDFYARAYRAIRAHAPPGRVTVVFHDGFRPASEYAGFFDAPLFEDVLYDLHRYQCFERADLDLDVAGHLKKAGFDAAREADEVQRTLGIPAICGEWSLGLDLKVVSLWAPGPYDHALDRLDRFGEDVALRAYGAAQLASFERYRGWFFWSYRTMTTPAWSFRDAVERGWLPARYD